MCDSKKKKNKKKDYYIQFKINNIYQLMKY